jgi:hypothetical protein
MAARQVDPLRGHASSDRGWPARRFLKRLQGGVVLSLNVLSGVVHAGVEAQ